MSIEYIEQPYRDKVIEILSSTDNKESIQLTLKLYLLSEDYFKKFSSEPTWLTKDIINDFKK
jgi:hypothetical protein|tara:strand:+ start:97 stop:282 length:186 start_codon:yes stop_codon:yes gene_type:complete